MYSWYTLREAYTPGTHPGRLHTRIYTQGGYIPAYTPREAIYTRVYLREAIYTRVYLREAYREV